MSQLDREFQFYQSKKDEFLSKYKGKFVVIRGEEVLGVYDDRVDAVTKTKEKYELGTFLVHHVVEDDGAIFHSRVRVMNDKNKVA